jgi:Ca-activated chloride channel homolog
VWRLLLILNLALAPVWAMGQTNAGDYFHKGVQYYIFGEKSNAMREIYTGLRTYPTDPPLNAAAKLLQKKDQEDQNKSNKSQQNQKQDQDKKDQKDQKDQKQQKQDQKSEQQKKDEEKARQEQAKKDKEKKEQEKKEQQAQEQKGEPKDKQDEQPEQAAAELHMSPQEARQLLDQLKDDAKVLLFTPTNQPINTQRGKFKDW